jgi:hypothetical protein
MICFALAKGDSVKAIDIFWNMPLVEVWMLLWCYYSYNDTKVRKIGEEEDDLGALMG